LLLFSARQEFSDPLTRYSSLSGYLFNIQMLRRVFAPTFRLHSVARTGALELTTRWTMGMTLAVNPLSALGWAPQLLFTGVSILNVSATSGKLCSHVDKWDSLQNNDYLSLEAVADLIKQARPSREQRCVRK
jgi:hypothetical protein